MKQSVTVGAQLLWGSRYGCNNGLYGCTIVMSYIEINKAVSQWLLTFNLCVSVTWPLTCAFHIPCTHNPEIIDMHRGVSDNSDNQLGSLVYSRWIIDLFMKCTHLVKISCIKMRNKFYAIYSDYLIVLKWNLICINKVYESVCHEKPPCDLVSAWMQCSLW